MKCIICKNRTTDEDDLCSLCQADYDQIAKEYAKKAEGSNPSFLNVFWEDHLVFDQIAKDLKASFSVAN